MLFSCVLGLFRTKKRSKITKIQEKCKKYAKKFAYIKNLLYLCTRFRKQTNQRWRQHHKNGNKVMLYVIQLTSTWGNEYTNEPMYDRFLGYYAADGRACEQVVSFKNAAKFPTKEKAEFVARHMVHLGANNVANVMSEVEAEKWIA